MLYAAVVVAVAGSLSSACDSKKTETDKSGASSEVDSSRAIDDGPQSVSIRVHEHGYDPDSVEAKAGKPLKLTFTRTTDAGGGEKLAFPDHGIEKDLPLGQPVHVELTPKSNENISFTCGMGMYEGSIVAKR